MDTPVIMAAVGIGILVVLLVVLSLLQTGQRDTTDAIEAFLQTFGCERVAVDQWVLHSLTHMPDKAYSPS
jgi:hypothetical protein